MPKGFDAQNPPFDRLTHEEIEKIRGAVDIEYFAPQHRIVEKGRTSTHLHVIIKGSVEARDGDSVQAVLSAKDSFDSRAVVHGAAGEDFIAVEETLCYLLPRELLTQLIARNAAFAAFFYSEVSRKLEAYGEQQRSGGFESVLRARVRDARHAPAIFLDGTATISAAGQHMKQHDVNALFVRDNERIGLITGMNLSKAVVLRELPLDTPIRDISHFDIVSVNEDSFVFEALLLMTRSNKRRLAVQSGTAYIGILEDIDILGLFAGNSQLIPGRIDRARSLADLDEAAKAIQGQVERLHQQGIKVDVIADITSELNRRLLRKLFDMVAPPSIQESGCLLLMGSEGRGEQTIRTDQDNGLLLDHELPEEDLSAFRQAFSSALTRMEFPACPGNIMISNPVWSRPVDDFIRQLKRWVLQGDPDAAMNLAIFSDAIPVAGHGQILTKAKNALFDLMQTESALLARFANLMETFATPSLGVFNALMASVGVGVREIDLKKAGIFPIVHGVRTLAIQNSITATSTVDRIEALVDSRHLSKEFGQELIGALRALMEFRLRTQIQAVRIGDAARESVLRLDEISTADRDLLRDALRVVKQFRDVIRVRFNLGLF